MKLSEAIEKYGDCEVKSELIDLIDTNPKTIYDLKKGDEYYSISYYGDINQHIFINDYCDNCALSIGNIFLTEREARIASEKLKVETILRKYSYNFSQEEWNDEDVYKFYIAYIENNNQIRFPHNRYVKEQGTIYFESCENCQNAIDEVGEQRLINYFEGVL